MEIYSGNSDNQKNTTKEKRVFFKPSLLNFSIPIIEKWAFFLVGFIGIDIISLFFSFVVSISTKDSALQSSLLNFLTYLTLFLIFIAIIAFDKRKNYKKIFENFKNLTPLIYSIVALVVLIGFNFLTNYIVQSLGYSSNNNQTNIENTITSYPALSFFYLVIFAPIVEEFTYRLGFLDLVGHNKRLLGVFLSALLFALIHFDFQPIFNYYNPDYTGDALREIYTELINLPYYLIAGFTLSFVYAQSGNIFSSIYAHVGNNLLSYILIVAL